MRRTLLAVATALLVVGADLHAQQSPVAARAATLTLGGRLHYQYAWDSPDEADPADFFVRRARLTLDVRVNDAVDGRVMPDFAGGGAALQDAYVRLRLSDGFRLWAGQFKRSHEIFELASSTELPTIERDGRISGVDDCAGPGGVCTFNRLVGKLGFSGRDVGLKADGSLGGGLGYEASLTNGTGVNTSDENDAKSFSGRLSWASGSGVTVSGFWGVHDHPGLDDPEDTDYASSAGFDLEIGDFQEGFHLMAAAVQGDNWQAGPDADFRAAEMLASWYRPVGASGLEAWEPAVRVGWADPDTEVDDDHAVLFTPGLMVYVLGRNRIGANLDVYSPATGDTEVSFKLQTYLYF